MCGHGRTPRGCDGGTGREVEGPGLGVGVSLPPGPHLLNGAGSTPGFSLADVSVFSVEANRKWEEAGHRVCAFRLRGGRLLTSRGHGVLICQLPMCTDPAVPRVGEDSPGHKGRRCLIRGNWHSC